MSDVVGGLLDGRYQLVRELGRGPAGAVFEAHDRQLGHQVAIRTAAPGPFTTPAGIERFLYEAITVGRLAHPHLVAVQDRGGHYLVMELLAGRTADTLIAAGPVDLGRALLWAQHACAALQAAHAARVLHWGLTPGRLLVTEQGGLKLLGFGTAHLAPAAETGGAAYLAPEQWLQVQADGRADLYALGCVLYELCTGRRPFQGASAQELMYRHLNEPAPVPGQLRGGLPAGLDELVLALLAKDPAGRPSDAAEVRGRLAALAAGLAPAAAPAVLPVAPAVLPVAPPVAPAVPAAPVAPPVEPPAAPAAAPVASPAEQAIRNRVDQAWAYGEGGNPAEAVRQLTLLVPEAVRVCGPTAQQTLQVCFDLAIWRGMIHDVAGAVGLLTDLVPMMIAALGPGNEDVAQAIRDLESFRRDLARKRQRPGHGPRAGELAMLLGYPGHHPMS
ncbi:hypothetical protein P3T36_002500 [Kitasatospora sp. MAP12-15]|uniref:serine/threonine-protein kinase n=1 Tax=unclassified Kitasatospora TaxID=2633591 RepID=UPI00247334FB|nr:serine/threonine-protein kinase [Kitasatospora sp. MAP12-44]MDH6112782.1 hypothetical protein [Kitasatospora sp. MAP12-44]